MRKVLLFAVAVMMTFFVSAQTIVFQENFESSTIALTTTADSLGYPVSNFQAWAASTNLYKSGVKADSNVLQSGRTIYLTTSSFSTSGNSNGQKTVDIHDFRQKRDSNQRSFHRRSAIKQI